MENTLQFSAPFYLTFGITLAALFFFGLFYAWFVRKLARHGVQGQTAYTVVGGVAATLLGSVTLIGWVNVALLLACFAASGLPMVLEYAQRVHAEQKQDRQNAANIAKGLLE